MSSRKDIRRGLILLGVVACWTAVLFAADRRPGLGAFAGTFWGVILIIRGARLRREAWQLRHLGYIEREREQEGFSSS